MTLFRLFTMLSHFWQHFISLESVLATCIFLLLTLSHLMFVQNDGKPHKLRMSGEKEHEPFLYHFK